MSLSSLFLIWKFVVLDLGYCCMTFNFTTQMTLRNLLPMPMNEKIMCRDRKIYSKMLRKIYKKEV